MAKYTVQAGLKKLLERQWGSEVKGLKCQARKLDLMLEAGKVLSRKCPGPTVAFWVIDQVGTAYLTHFVPGFSVPRLTRHACPT